MYVHVVDGVNSGRSTDSVDGGRYELANLEPGAFTVQFGAGEYVDVRRADEFRVDTTLDVQLEKKGFVLSGVIKTQWGEPIGDVGVNALHEGRIMGGAGGERAAVPGGYRIPTLPAMDYIVRALKWGYVTQERPVTMTGDTTLDFVLDRVRVSMFGAVKEAASCAGAIQDARVEIVSGPDAGVSALSTATGYQLKSGARDQLGQVHASRVQDRLPAGRAVDRSFAAGVELRHAATASGESIVSSRANLGLERRAPGFRPSANGRLLTRTTSAQCEMGRNSCPGRRCCPKRS